MTIQEFSKQTGLSKDTIRYYEKLGILPKPARTSGGYRQYKSEMVEDVLLLRRAKDLGMSLHEMKELAILFRAKKLRRKEMSERLTAKLSEIDAKIEALNLLKLNIQQALAGFCEFKNQIAR